MAPSFLAEFVRSPALAVRARRRFGVLPLPADTRYTDEVNLPDLRRRRPEWRAEPLAPVSVAQDPWCLPSEPDGSLACLIFFELFAAGDRLPDAFAAGARVLGDDGVMMVTVCSEADLDAWPSDVAAGVRRLAAREGVDAPEAWSFELGAMLVASQRRVYQRDFELEFAGRVGHEDVYLLRRLGVAVRPGQFVQHEGAIYIVEGALLRHVVSPEALALARRADQHIARLGARAFARVRVGRPFTTEDARTMRSALA